MRTGAGYGVNRKEGEMKSEQVVVAMTSRRRFLKGAGCCFWGAALLSSGLTLQPFGSRAFARGFGGKPMDHLKYATFSKLIGETFTMRLSTSEAVPLKLVEAVERGCGEQDETQGPRQESFSILFHGPRERNLPQGTYHFHHHRTSDFALFIVPVGVDETDRHYEAVINRLGA